MGSDLGSAADSGNESITADFSASPLTGEAPLTVQFTDRSTGSPETWEWDFGDGGTSSAKNPSHTYSRAGTYTVSLEAGNGVSSDSEVTKNFITVKEKPVVPVVEASFSANTTSGKAPLTVRFTDSSGGGPTAWKWDFGDSTTSATQNPVHTYSAAGKYSVTLRATNGTVSDDVTRSDYITVDGNGPLASFTASPLEGLALLPSSLLTLQPGARQNGNGTSETAANQPVKTLPTLIPEPGHIQ